VRSAIPIVISLLLTSTTFAEENSGPVPLGSQPYPISAGRPHTCLDLYPAPERASRVEGETQLRFTVTMDGSVKGVAVVKSSGNLALDDAAVTCAARWQYKSLPMEVNHGGSVYWRVPH
jgi:TonB family protein